MRNDLAQIEAQVKEQQEVKIESWSIFLQIQVQINQKGLYQQFTKKYDWEACNNENVCSNTKQNNSQT